MKTKLLVLTLALTAFVARPQLTPAAGLTLNFDIAHADGGEGGNGGDVGGFDGGATSSGDDGSGGNGGSGGDAGGGGGFDAAFDSAANQGAVVMGVLDKLSGPGYVAIYDMMNPGSAPALMGPVNNPAAAATALQEEEGLVPEGHMAIGFTGHMP